MALTSFFGNLYHLNAEQEPEHPDYPKDPSFKEKSVRAASSRPLPAARSKIPAHSTIERMRTIDDEVTAGSLDFLERASKSGKPFFLWWNSTRMHIWTHLKPSAEGKTGLGIYPDGMVEHDAHVERSSTSSKSSASKRIRS